MLRRIELFNIPTGLPSISVPCAFISDSVSPSQKKSFCPSIFALHFLPSQKKTKGHESLIGDRFLQSTLKLLN